MEKSKDSRSKAASDRHLVSGEMRRLGLKMKLMTNELDWLSDDLIFLHHRVSEMAEDLYEEIHRMREDDKDKWDALSPSILDMLKYLRGLYEDEEQQREWWKEVYSLVPGVCYP